MATQAIPLTPIEVIEQHRIFTAQLQTARHRLLRQAIQKAGGQNALCRAIGFSPANLSATMHGRRTIGGKLIDRVIEFLEQPQQPQGEEEG